MIKQPLVRFLIAMLAGCSAATGLQAKITSRRLLAEILKETPAPTIVTAGTQMKAAQAAAGAIAGGDFFYGVGQSMAPLFPSRTALVVSPLPFEQLRAGMTVVYVTRSGRMLAHTLTGDIPGGWIAQGVNNDEEDDDLVTRTNLVGVVVAAFSAEPSGWRKTVTQQLATPGRWLAVNW